MPAPKPFDDVYLHPASKKWYAWVLGYLGETEMLYPQLDIWAYKARLKIITSPTTEMSVDTWVYWHKLSSKFIQLTLEEMEKIHVS